MRDWSMSRQTMVQSHPLCLVQRPGRRVQSGAESPKGGSVETGCNRRGPRHPLGQSCTSLDVAVPVVLPGPGEPLPAAPARREYAPKHVKIRMEDLRKWGRTAGCRRCTLMTNGEPAKGIPHTRACRDRIEQAMKDDGNERFFAAEARLNQRLGDEASEAELPAEEECGAGPSAPAVPEAPAMDPAAVTAGDDGDRVDGDGPDADVAEAGGGRLLPSTDC